ncbi:hypothetical protein K8I85_16640 [bacterium]|nr:hypothetical protein [bacterium]
MTSGIDPAVREPEPAGDADRAAGMRSRFDPAFLARRLFTVLVACELVMVLLDATWNHLEWSRVGSIQRLVNITREDGITNWFAASQEMLVAIVLAIVAWRVAATGDRRRANGWTLLSVFFLYISFDDGTKFHERIGTWFKETANGIADAGGTLFFTRLLDAFPSYNWQVVFLPFFGAAGLFVLWFLWKEFDAPLRRLLVIALGLFVVAVVLDWIEGLEDGWGFVRRATHWRTDTIRHFGKSIEEFIEMFATTLFLVAFLRHLARVGDGWMITLGNGKGSDAARRSP